MGQRDVERALGRLLTDERFRRDFYLDPLRASARMGLQLTGDEMEALAGTPRSALADLGSRMDDRICRLCVDPAAPEEKPPPTA